MSVQLPRQLVDSLQAAFLGEAKRLCRDAAQILHVPEKEVLQKILPANSKVKLAILDDSDLPQTCHVLVPEGALVKRCRGPCVLGTGRCLLHQTVSIPEIDSHSATKLTRVEKDQPDDPPLWCDEESGLLYDAEGTPVGYRTDSVTRIFLMEEAEDGTE
jgi:hypothetical protein